MKVVKSFTIPIDLAEKLEKAAKARITSQSAIVTASLQKYFESQSDSSMIDGYPYPS